MGEKCVCAPALKSQSNGESGHLKDHEILE